MKRELPEPGDYQPSRKGVCGSFAIAWGVPRGEIACIARDFDWIGILAQMRTPPEGHRKTACLRRTMQGPRPPEKSKKKKNWLTRSVTPSTPLSPTSVPKTISQPEPDKPLGRQEMRVLPKVCHWNLVGAGATACLRERRGQRTPFESFPSYEFVWMSWKIIGGIGKSVWSQRASAVTQRTSRHATRVIQIHAPELERAPVNQYNSH